MAETQIDINELLEDFARENAKQTQRAIVAEAQVKAKDKVIDYLANQVGELRAKYEPEALEADMAKHGLAAVADPAPEPSKPAAKKAATRKRAAAKSE